MEREMRKHPQVNIDTEHCFHAGMYARTIVIPANTALTGVLIKIPTLLIVEGSVWVTIGDEVRLIMGYEVIPCAANRKTAYMTRCETRVTMIFTTRAETVEAAESEFTDEPDLLMTRRNLGTQKLIKGD